MEYVYLHSSDVPDKIENKLNMPCFVRMFRSDNKQKSPKVVVQRREVQSTTNRDVEGLTNSHGVYLVIILSSIQIHLTNLVSSSNRKLNMSCYLPAS